MRPRRIIILGGSGFLGQNLVKLFKGYEEFEVLASFNESKPEISGSWFHFNISNSFELLESLKNFKPDLLINSIAMANVEECEKNLFTAINLNSNFPKFLSWVCDDLGIKLIHISTDHFESANFKPRQEGSTVWSVNNYGESKLLGEKFVLENSNSLVIRVNFFGIGNVHHKSSLDRLIEKINSNNNMYGFINITFSPVSIDSLFNYLIKLIEVDAKGLFNIASSNEMSKCDFMELVSQHFPKYDGKIKPVEFHTGDFGLTRRPEYMSLDSNLANKLLNTEAHSIEFMVRQVLLKANY